MAVVDRNILRLATFELRYCPDVPFKVTLNEAVELAKKFGADDSGAFFNGILDRVQALLDQTLIDNPDIPWAQT
jgi:N utilization substance protein B